MRDGKFVIDATLHYVDSQKKLPAVARVLHILSRTRRRGGIHSSPTCRPKTGAGLVFLPAPFSAIRNRENATRVVDG